MSLLWKEKPVSLRFLLGDKSVFTFQLTLQTCEVGLMDLPPLTNSDFSKLAVADCVLEPGCAGFFMRWLPIETSQPTLRWLSDFLCYVPSQGPRYYIDLSQSFDEYQQKFSSKTRGTIRRKIRRFAAYCGGSIQWQIYKTPADTENFYALASAVSARTYQEKRLGAGLPRSKEFLENLRTLAAEGQFRGYILFHDARPVGYLCCPAKHGVLEYQHLGYDAEYRAWSVGTILLWQALESIHHERHFKIFDFAGGQTDQIQLFATHSTAFANVFLLRRSLKNIILVHTHRGVSDLSTLSGRLLERLGLKGKARRLIRFWNLGPSACSGV
jgi:CelD/BcsL family acetyltransferase involved in cellulose biosynthesis